MFSDFGCKAAIKREPSSLLEWPSVSRLARFSRAKVRKIRETSVRFAEIFSLTHRTAPSCSARSKESRASRPRSIWRIWMDHGVSSTDHKGTKILIK